MKCVYFMSGLDDEHGKRAFYQQPVEVVTAVQPTCFQDKNMQIVHSVSSSGDNWVHKDTCVWAVHTNHYTDTPTLMLMD